MTRAQRATHPLIWTVVAVAAAAVIVTAWLVRPAETPATLPDAAVAAIDEAS